MRFEPLALVREFLLTEEAPYDRDRLSRARERLLDHDPVASLHEADAPGAKAKGTKASVRKIVNAARTHGEQGRSARVEIDDGRAETDCLGLSRQHRKNRERILARLLGGAERRVAE